MVHPAILPRMSTPRLPVVDWTDGPADLNGFARFAEKRNLVSARVPSHFKRNLQLDRSQMTITRMRWIRKVHTHSEYVILTAFPPQKWLNERASMLHYTYIAYLVTICLVRLQQSPLPTLPHLIYIDTTSHCHTDHRLLMICGLLLVDSNYDSLCSWIRDFVVIHSDHRSSI
jgi:hypothetical protein